MAFARMVAGLARTPPQLPEWWPPSRKFTSRWMRMPPRQPKNNVGRSAESRGPSEASSTSAFNSSRSCCAHFRQIRRADFLAGLDDEFDVEAELAAPRLLHRAQRRHVDAVLAFVVGRAAAVDAVAHLRRTPGIEVVPPLARHAVDDIAMAIDQDGRRRGVLAVFGQKIGAFAGGQLDQPGREIHFGEGRLKVVGEIGLQSVALFRVLAFGLVGDPAIELVKKFSRTQHGMGAGDGIGSGHGILFASSMLTFHWSR